jgi:Spy/CpxP family protein refolding chaperone
MEKAGEKIANRLFSLFEIKESIIMWCHRHREDGNMRSRLVVLIVFLALALCAASAMAQRGGPKAGNPAACPQMGAPGAGFGIDVICERLKTELNLTPAQTEQILAIRKDFADSTQALRADIKTLTKQLADLWKADDVNPAAIKDVAAQIDNARAQVRNIGIDHALAALNVLNDDQKAKVKSLACNNPGLCLGAGCGIGCGPGCGMGVGMGQGKCAGPCGGKGMGMGANAARCPYVK